MTRAAGVAIEERADAFRKSEVTVEEDAALLERRPLLGIDPRERRAVLPVAGICASGGNKPAVALRLAPKRLEKRDQVVTRIGGKAHVCVPNRNRLAAVPSNRLVDRFERARRAGTG